MKKILKVGSVAYYNSVIKNSLYKHSNIHRDKMLKSIKYVLFAALIPAVSIAQDGVDTDTIEPEALGLSMQMALGLMKPIEEYNPSFRFNNGIEVSSIYGNSKPTLAQGIPPFDSSNLVGITYNQRNANYYFATGGPDAHLYEGNFRETTINSKLSLVGINATGIGFEVFEENVIILTDSQPEDDLKLLIIDPTTMKTTERVYEFSQFPGLQDNHISSTGPTMELLAVDNSWVLLKVIGIDKPYEEGPFYVVPINEHFSAGRPDQVSEIKLVNLKSMKQP